jgi:hypothetical protein
MRAVVTTQATLPSFIVVPKSKGEEERRRKRRKSETPHPKVHGARAAVGDYRLGRGGGVDGGQYTGPVLAVDVSRAVGDGRDYRDCD